MSLRVMPNLCTIRPADANEVREAWIAAVERKEKPTALVLTRQNVPTIDRNKFSGAENLHKGAYILADLGNSSPEMILMAAGSEVQLIIEVGERLASEGVSVRLVSFPSWELFKEQPSRYQKQVLEPSIKKRISVEAGVCLGWERWIGDEGIAIGVDKFGSSAPGETLLQKYGLTAKNIYEKAKKIIERG